MKLIFVYNADSGFLNTAKDIGQKLFNPAGYDCFLCSLTHGTFRENKKWKDFRQTSPLTMEFLHRDEFEKRYGSRMEYPAILRESSTMETIFSRERLAAISDLDQLISEIKALENGV